MNIFFKIFSRIMTFLGIHKYHFGFTNNKKIEDYENIHNLSKNKIYIDVDKLERKFQFKINKIFFENLAFHTQVVIKKNELNYQHGRVLYTYLSNYIFRNKSKNSNINILETGTARGFSSVCMSKALLDSKTSGKIFTIDILPHNVKMVWNCPKDLQEKSTRSDILKEWMNELSNIVFLTGSSKNVLNKLFLNRVHFAFLDGLHTYNAVKYEFDYINARQITGDIIIFDDVVKNKYNGVVRCINDIKKLNIYNIDLLKISNFRTFAIATKK